MGELLSIQDVVQEAAGLTNASIVCSGFDNLKCEICLDTGSEAVSAALGFCAAEKRTIALTSSITQESVNEAAAMRMPLIIVTTDSPEQVMALRDAGALIFFCGSHQELFDAIIRSLRICEDPKVLLPCVISWNGPVSYLDPVLPLSDQIVRNFLPPLKLPHRLDVKKPSVLGAADPQSRKQQQKAMEQAWKLYQSIEDVWSKKFKRSWPAYDCYKTDDADLIVVAYGYHASTARALVDSQRAAGKKPGLVTMRMLRPFPAMPMLKGKKLAVLDHSASPGSISPLFCEIKPHADFCMPFISLEKYLSERDFAEIFDRLGKAEKEEAVWI